MLNFFCMSASLIQLKMEGMMLTGALHLEGAQQRLSVLHQGAQKNPGLPGMVPPVNRCTLIMCSSWAFREA